MIMIILLILCPHISLSSILDNNMDAVTSNDVTVDFMKDLIHKQTETTNIAFFFSRQDAEILYQLQEKHLLSQQSEAEQLVGITLMDYDDIDKGLVDRINKVSRVDNIPALYVVLQPEDKTVSDVNELAHRLRSWGVKAKMSIIFHNNIDLTIYTEEGIYNIYLFTPAARDGGYTQYDVCYLCNQGQDQVILTNIWRKGAGFNHRVRLEESFKGNFHGKTVTMDITYWKPAIYPTGIDDKVSVTLEGYLYHNYMVLEGMLNIKWKFKSSKNWALVSSDDKPVGSLADLLHGEVDLIGGGWFVRYRRYKHADVTASTYFFTPEHIVSIEPPKILTFFALLDPFKWYMWLLILVCILADSK